MFAFRTLGPGFFLLLPPLLLAGCTDMRMPGADGAYAYPQAPGLDSHPEYEDVRKAATAMLEGIRLYDEGRYDAAIEKLSDAKVQAAAEAIRVEALKYIAFSYCVTENFTQCRAAFDAALRTDANFRLRDSEIGHPMWGSIYHQAKTDFENKLHDATERQRWRGIDPWRPR